MGSEAHLVIDIEDKIGRINRNIYGHFIEHIERIVYGGIWVGEDSTIPNLRGLRKDVLEAAKKISPPIIRWPGGCFADGYHWLDGIGPKEKRPTKYDLAWEREEPNQFGTDEFIDFCREVGAEAYICVNLGSGTAEEAAHWVEYCNRRGKSMYASMRMKKGDTEPFNVKYWGLGNQSFATDEIGCFLEPRDYAKKATQFALSMRRADPTIKLIAVGCGAPGYPMDEWNYEVLETLA